jgi:AcrR family transcriptional regulator
MAARRPRRRTGEIAERRTPAERRKQILDATREVIRNQGLAMVTMERVAIQAGVSKPVVYSQFANRGVLLAALLEEFWTDLDERILRDVAGRTSPASFARQVTTSYFDALAMGGPALQEVLSSGSEEPEVDVARKERSRRIETIWSEYYQRSLYLRPETANAAASILRAAVAGAGAFWISNPEVDRDECTNVCISVVTGALNELSQSAVRQPT